MEDFGPSTVAVSTTGTDSPTEKGSTQVKSAEVTIRSTAPLKGEFYSGAPQEAITVREASFGWDPEKPALLKSIGLAIPRQELTMVVGPVGCGKSTLLKALLGEVPCISGIVEIASTSVAYCDQTPYHMNQSIRNSIVAFAKFDQRWYESVIHACALEDDLRQLPRGDKTVVGSSGVSISGGQSQRIALARAVYAQKDIVILDDVLSGVDAATENHIFHSLLGQNGLLRSCSSSVILTSSSRMSKPLALSQ
jgi:ABC-type bacteriocin/lantibiotic exporter with double-glycine peptidase domain